MSDALSASCDGPPHECEHKFRLRQVNWCEKPVGDGYICGGGLYECVRRNCGAWYCSECHVRDGVISPQYSSAHRNASWSTEIARTRGRPI